MRSHRILDTVLLGLTVLVGLTLASASPLLAGEEVAEREGLECAVCHPEGDDTHALLTDRGQYYRLMETLEGFELVVERFGECTYCHAQEAGSSALTREGHRFQWMMEDMTGLREWLEEVHPRPAEEPSSETSTPTEGPEGGD